MSTILFIMILYSITNVMQCDVYYVTPDDSCCSNNYSCDQCYNLQHYLLNVSKYFTAHTQLHFLPGIHYLHSNLVIQNVSNISLIGITANGGHTTIQCNGSHHIILRNNNNITIKKLVITKCGFNLPPNVTVAKQDDSTQSVFHTVQLYYCNFVTIVNMIIMSRTKYDTIMNSNTMGHSVFHNISSAGMVFIYHDNKTTNNFTSIRVLIDNYQCNFNTQEYKITINLEETSFTVHLKITNINLCNILNLYISIGSCNQYVIEINDCKCSGEIFHKKPTFFEITEYDDRRCSHEDNIIQYKNCHFVNVFRRYDTLTLIEISSYSGMIKFVDCSFVNTSNVALIKIILSKYKLDVGMYQKISTLIKNTSFILNKSPFSLITLSERVLLLDGPVLFIGAQVEAQPSQQALISSSNAIIHFHNYTEISNCNGYGAFFNVLHLILEQPAIISVNHNTFRLFTYYNVYPSSITDLKYPLCMFQYFSDQNLDLPFTKKEKLNYSITFESNKWTFIYKLNSDSLRTTHCSWLPGSAFNVTLPVDVNQRFIKFVNESFFTKKKSLCYCTGNNSMNCYKDQLGPIYPGQTLNIKLAYRYSNFVELIIDVHDVKLPPTACKISSLQQTKQIVTKTCTMLKFTILQANSHYEWCELIFKTHNTELLNSNDAFYIRFYPCPIGFANINGSCQCDPVLESGLLSIDDCDINDQTILRPANSWISATTNNETFTYLVSLDCPFDYCSPYPSYLQLSLTADLQCQFRRHSLLCGQCSDGLSTVFGSSHCQQCSNANMFIIVPIAILGLLLVVLLFCLNLTVADGTINVFILYVNMLSINSAIFFPLHDIASLASYIFISISNLDMGIEMCFYDGMDDYAKMWLQLLFPLYLIIIAAILIMASRYCSKVQRLTARRALPVLATLFLLSYTKILRTVSSVLFSYSTIIHLPSNHIKYVWSVDANVNMSEFRFIALFIVCLIIFILLIPFNITLLFTRTLSRFKIVNYFKPLLDVYQGPFKIKCYYWTGIHLVIKAIFFGLSALDKKINLLIGSMMLFAIEGIVGYTRPYKNWFQNCSEMILLFNLNAQYVLILSSQNITAVNVMITLAAVQFVSIVIYHIFNYTLAENFKSRIQQCVSTLANIKFSKRSNNKSIKLFHHMSYWYRNKIPDVTYDYSEYQEPLVGED